MNSATSACDTEMERQIREIVGVAADLDPGKIDLDDDFFDKLAIDSLGLVHIYVELGYSLRISEEVSRHAAPNIRTTRQLIDFVRSIGK